MSACDTPFFVKHSNPAMGEIPVPCGRCPPCKHRRVNSWVFRLVQEEKRSHSAHFVTLTYASHSVPISTNGFMSLKPEDMRLYWKRLRKICRSKYGVKIKYYYCGEYGGTTERPHYHAIIFNVPDDRLFSEAWSLNGVPIGGVHVGSVTQDSIAYTLKYIDKSSWSPKHSRDDRFREFSRMSQGLGLNYLTPEIVQWHRSSPEHMFCSLYAGHRIALPRYYKRKMFTDDEVKEMLPHVQNAVKAAQVEKESDILRLNPDADLALVLEERRLERYRLFYYRQNIKKRKL